MNRFPGLLFALAMALSTNIHAAGSAEAHHSHEHGGGAPAGLQLNGGEKWATDEPLRRAMGDINEAMAKALPLIHRQRYEHRDYQALATMVHDKVAYMVDHCKLEAQADAMLHLIVAELISGAESMEGKTASSRHDGAVRVRAALKAYGKYFRHPGWVTAKG